MVVNFILYLLGVAKSMRSFFKLIILFLVINKLFNLIIRNNNISEEGLNYLSSGLIEIKQFLTSLTLE